MNPGYQSLNIPNNPWMHNPNSIWLTSTLKISRNIQKYLFPGKLDQVRREKLMASLKDILLADPHFKEALFFPAHHISPTDKQFLFEHFLSAISFHQAHQGEGFLIDAQGLFLIAFNLQDHLQMQLIDQEGELEESLRLLMNFETAIGSSLKFAFLSKFGFLTADPYTCGTALTICTYLHIPALIHSGKLHEVLSSQREEGIQPSSLEGSLDEILGDIICMQNNYTLGLSEERMISAIRSATLHIIVAEKSARNELRKTQGSTLKDKVSKAFGLLKHAYQLETKEAINALSLCKLGLELEWLQGISMEELNSLLFLIRRGHLLRHFQQNLQGDEQTQKRAHLIHEKLKQACLTEELN